MDNSWFVNDENIPLVHDEDISYDDYNTPNTSRVNKTSLNGQAPRKKNQHQLYG